MSNYDFRLFFTWIALRYLDLYFSLMLVTEAMLFKEELQRPQD